MLINGNATIRRFNVDPISDSNNILKSDVLDTRIERCSFKPVNDELGEREKIGWVNPLNILSSDVNVAKSEFAQDLYVFMVRRDKKTLPPAILKARNAEAIKEARQGRGGRKLAKEEVVEIKERIADKLQRETSATTAIVDMIWNVDDGILLVGSTGRAAEAPVDLFTEATGLDVDLINPQTLAKPNDMSFADAMFEFESYGPDFLTWILSKCMGQTGEFAIPGTEAVQMEFVGDLVFMTDGLGARKVTLSGGDASNSSEVEQFLKERRKVVKAKMSVSQGLERWTFTLDGLTFEYKNLSLSIAKDGSEFIELRYESISNLFKLMDSVYKNIFLPIRHDNDAWESEQRGWSQLSFNIDDDIG